MNPSNYLDNEVGSRLRRTRPDDSRVLRRSGSV